MLPSLDIFKIDSGGVIWRGAAENLEAAKAHIQKLALSSPGQYLVFDQATGQRVPIMPSGVPTQASVPDVRIKAQQAVPAEQAATAEAA